MTHFTEAERSLIANAMVKIAVEGQAKALEQLSPEAVGLLEFEETTYDEALFVVNAVLNLAQELRNVREEGALDLQGIPTAACPSCGDRWLKVPMMFDEDTYDVAGWGTEGECYSCGSLVTVCTPVDSELEDEDDE